MSEDSRKPSMSPIYENAVDSLRIGMGYFLKETSYSTRKHAILTLFHAVELLLKERLARANPILIYKNIDAKITDDAQTVGAREALVRLENLGLGIPPEEKKTIEDIQRIRNRIEHHRFDHSGIEADAIIASSLKFILFFAEFELNQNFDGHIDGQTLREINHRVLEYNERAGLAEYRFKQWERNEWPNWKEEEEDSPEEFGGTLPCPECRQDWLVMGYHDSPFCFFCNCSVDADACEDCGEVFRVIYGCGCGKHRGEAKGILGVIFDQMRSTEIVETGSSTERSKSQSKSDT